MSWVSVVSMLTSMLAMTCSVLLAHGRVKAVYRLGIVVQSGFIIVNVALVRIELGTLWFVIPSVWSIFCHCFGLRRLAREAKVTP